MMLPLLPADTISEICSHCSQDTLTICALVDSTFLEASRIHLYTHLKLFDNLGHRSKQLAGSALHLLNHTRHLYVRTLDYSLGEHLIRPFQRLIQLQQLVSFHLNVLWTAYPASAAFASCIVELSRMPSLQRIRARFPAHRNEESLVPLLLSPALRDIFLSPDSPDLPGVTVDRNAILPFIDTLRIEIFDPLSLNVRWPSPLALNLRGLKRLEIRHIINWDGQRIRSPNFLETFVLEIPAEIQSLALIWEVYFDAREGLFFHDYHPLCRFTSLKELFIHFACMYSEPDFTLDTVSDVLSGTVRQLSPHTPIQTIQILLTHFTKCLSQEDFGSHPCWMDIRRQYPSAFITLHLMRSDEGNPELVVPGVDEVLWLLPGLSEWTDAIEYEWPFSGVTKVTDRV